MKNKLYLLFSFLVSILSLSIVKIELQNDTFSAIKIGDYILKHGIDFKEHFNFNPDLLFHNARWLFNTIIAFIYNNLDFIGIYLFVVILSILLGLLLFNVLYKRNKSLFLSFIITVLTMSYLSGFITARSQTVSYILFFLEIVFIEKLIETNKFKYSIYLIIVSILIANIHTTVWIVTLVLFFPYFAEYVLSKFIKNKRLYSDIKSIKLLLITFILVLLSGLVTPLGLLPYTYMFKTMSGISPKYIIELQPINILTNYNVLLLSIVFVYLFIRKKIKISDLFLVTGLFILALLAARNVPLFILLTTISLSRTIMNNNSLNDKILKNKLVILSLIVLVLLISGFNYIVGVHNQEFVNSKRYPVKASNYILKNIDIDNMRLFNSFGNGSYLEFRGIKVFLDSRSEVYCKEFNNTSILEDYYDIYYLKKNYKTILDKYDFTHILLETNTQLNTKIEHDTDYKKIYSDSYYVLYEKKTSN